MIDFKTLTNKNLLYYRDFYKKASENNFDRLIENKRMAAAKAEAFQNSRIDVEEVDSNQIMDFKKLIDECNEEIKRRGL